jgi:hypothetical protein
VFQLFLRQNIKPDHSMIYKNTDIPMKNPWILSMIQKWTEEKACSRFQGRQVQQTFCNYISLMHQYPSLSNHIIKEVFYGAWGEPVVPMLIPRRNQDELINIKFLTHRELVPGPQIFGSGPQFWFLVTGFS